MPNASRPGSPGSRIVLHIGAMKTGTTFLQQLMADNRRALGSNGFLVPRKQAVALRGVLDDSPGPRGRRHAERLLAEVAGHPGAALVSWEFLSFADRERGSRLLDAFGSADVRVVLTVRDAARTMPAQWQTTARNGTTLPWPRFARGIGTWLDTGRSTRSSRVFERTQGVPRMLEVWTGLLGAERVQVVTVPASGGDPLLLWRRFAEAAGIDPELAVDHDVRRNPSLGHPSSELLRRVNVELDRAGWPDGAERVVRAVVAADLETRAAQEPPIRPDRRGRAVAAGWNRMVRDAIERSGVAVVGTLADLPDRPAPDAADPAPPSEEQLLAAAETARSGLVGIGARSSYDGSGGVDAAVADLASMIRQTAGADLAAARKERGRGRW